MLALGMSADQIDRRARSGAWKRLRPGVYRLGPVAESFAQKVAAAVLWFGEDAVVSHESAAMLWRLPGYAEEIEISAGSRSHWKAPGMRIHAAPDLTAADVVMKGPFKVTSAARTLFDLADRSSDDELADIIFQYGDERRSRRIARSIKKAVAGGELRTTLDLRRAIVRAVGPARIGGVDPATRTFQALRIAVNGELTELQTLLSSLPAGVRVGGRVAILSFHSLEDRAVKRSFVAGPWAPSTKKPVVPSDEECDRNPRARSAKLRSAVRTPGDGAGPQGGF